jgi:hypothetical protein
MRRGANRCGKTVAGAYELTNHALGKYPDWWPGYRFNEPIRAWAAGEKAESVSDIIQLELLGPVGEWGTGMIPKRNLHRIVAFPFGKSSAATR